MNSAFTFALVACTALIPVHLHGQGRGGPGSRGPGALPVVIALDKDKDGDLSTEEMANATAALTELDENGDGNLTGAEFLPDFGGRGRRGPGGPQGAEGRGGQDRPPREARVRDGARERPRGPRGPGGFIRMIPVMSALDADQNGEISTEELKNATVALQRLDKNRDEKLSGSEIFPDFRGGRGGSGGETASERQDPEQVELQNGAATLPDRETFEKLSYQGSEVMIDTHLDGNEFVKFQIERADTDTPQLYFINTQTHRAHFSFMRAVGIPRSGRGPGGGAGQMRGVLVYRPLAKSPTGNPGLYTFEFEPNDAYPFEEIKFAYELLLSKSALLKGNLGYYPMPRAVPVYEKEKAKYDASELRVYFDKDFLTDIAFLPLNPGETFGRLRLMEPGELPAQRDIVLYSSLPNEMPRVAGIITAVRQTPLSHVNLRAIQDKVPNAYVSNASEDPSIAPLIGKYVAYKVNSQRFAIREATGAEVQAHFDKIRPAETQTPERDLSLTEIRSLNDIEFSDSKSVGVKAANVATMHSFGFAEGIVPEGYAVPFHFYNAFMEHNDFYAKARKITEDESIRSDRERLKKSLKSLRKKIEEGDLTEPMMEALADVQASFRGVSIRCRSSTNNEDLPGFSGAGLYDSYTHKPDEGHLGKSIKQVYASLWNLRAFEEREFYRIDHMVTAMGVLLHPSFKGEQANGVAVTDDPLYQTQGNYYVNAQVGEDLVTNPDEQSIPEEILLDWWDPKKAQIMQASNRVAAGEQVLGDQHLQQLSKCLAKIHGRFAKLYGHDPEDGKFAMEIEFKITREGELSIKQARPWVY